VLFQLVNGWYRSWPLVEVDLVSFLDSKISRPDFHIRPFVRTRSLRDVPRYSSVLSSNVEWPDRVKAVAIAPSARPHGSVVLGPNPSHASRPGRFWLSKRSRRPYCANCFGDIIRSQSIGENNRNSDKLDDAAADGSIVGHAERTDLAIRGPMAVRQQEIGYPLVAADKRDAGLPPPPGCFSSLVVVRTHPPCMTKRRKAFMEMIDELANQLAVCVEPPDAEGVARLIR
jgi:hypothetical protein